MLIVTMAGSGKRFRDAGYTVPKYAIKAHGQPLFTWAVSSLRQYLTEGWAVTFVAQEQDGAKAFIDEQCGILGIREHHTVELTMQTDGQATSALFAKQTLAGGKTPIAIYNIDTYVDPNMLSPAAMRGDGWIPCFPGVGDGWSFVRVDEANRALELREKQRISPHATIGFYGFSSFDLYERAYDEFYSKTGFMERGERYVAPLYNQLLSWNMPVYIERLPAEAIYPMGTPAELQEFLAEEVSHLR